MELEKNDVNVSALFAWGRKFEVVDEQNNVLSTVYMRLLGDADINKARVYALRKSADMRRKLTNKNSDEYVVYIREIDEVELEELYEGIILYSQRDFMTLANREVKVKVPVQPKGETKLEDMEKYQSEIDAYPEKYFSAIQKFVDKEAAKLLKELEQEDKETLYKKYVKMVINEFCEQEAMSAYKSMEIFLGCYKDPEYKERYFATFEDFENMNTELKNSFRAAYNTLDMKMDELKKLREATQ